MALVRVDVPPLGAGVERVLVIDWHVDVGTAVEVGDDLARVETDKTEVEIPSPVAGRVAELLAAVDAEVAVGAALCTIQPTVEP